MLSAALGHVAPGAASHQIDEELLEELSVTTDFTREEIRRLHRRFIALDAAGAGVLTAAQVFEIPELAHNQMRARLEEVWSAELATDLDLRAFVRLLSPFALGCPREHKFRFAFKMHDADGDGKIGEEDVRGLIRSLLGTNAYAAADVEAGGGGAHRPRRTATVAPAARAGATRRFASLAPAYATELDAELIDKVVENVYLEVDTDDDGMLSFEEWFKVVASTDIVSRLTFIP